MIYVEFNDRATAKRYVGHADTKRQAFANAYMGQTVRKGRYEYYRLLRRRTHDLIVDIYVGHVKHLRTVK